jgi:hypothetical protein
MGARFIGQTPSDLMTKITKNVRKDEVSLQSVLIEYAEKIKDESILNSPVDLHNLEDSHKVKVKKTPKRVNVSIEVGGTVNGVNVDDYAFEIHENYESLNPGIDTQLKRNNNPGRYVGEKYLERAFKDVLPELRKEFNQLYGRRL